MMSSPSVISSEVIYLIDGDVAIWAFHDYKDGMLSHVDIAKGCTGKEAVEKCKQAVKWIFSHTDKEVIYAIIDKDNKEACHNAIHSGLKFTHETNDSRCYEVKK